MVLPGTSTRLFEKTCLPLESTVGVEIVTVVRVLDAFATATSRSVPSDHAITVTSVLRLLSLGEKADADATTIIKSNMAIAANLRIKSPL
jgi:hypothetical protein